MSKTNIPCPECVADGVSDEEACDNVHISDDPKFIINGRPTGRCLRSGHHPHGGPVDYFLDTGEVIHKVQPTPFEWLYNKSPQAIPAWGIEAKLLTFYGIRGADLDLFDKFRENYQELGKKLISRARLTEAFDSKIAVNIYPLYDKFDISGIEIRNEQPKTYLRPGEYGKTGKGKEVNIIGTTGLYISNPYPKHTPDVVVIFEGAKDACIAASDNHDGDLTTVVFCGCTASFRYENIANTLHLRYPGATLISVGDRDKAGTQFQEKMLKLGAIPQSLKGCSGKDLGDEPDKYLRIEAVKQLVSAGVAEWRHRQEMRPTDLTVMGHLQKEGLVRTDTNGNQQASNRPITLKRIFDLDPKYQTLRRNLMGMQDYHDGIEITDEHVVEIQNDLDKRYGATWGIEQLERQISLKCSDNAFHPVRDYFDSLPKWDGVDRYPFIIDKILGTYPTKLTRAYLAIFHRGAVARVYQPGCKHDVVLILKSSKQGTGKTSYGNCCTVNIPGAFLEGHEDILSKDGLLAMHRGWIIELGEIDRITTKKDAEILKNFLSRRVDPIRPPYGRRVIDMLRQFVLFGTTNQGAFLLDTTGQRRFLVIETGGKPFDLDLLRSVIDQVWAQALAEYREGKPWWLDSKLEDQHQREMEVFQAEEPWTVMISNVLTDIKQERHKLDEKLCDGVTIAEILDNMNIRAESQSRGQANRAAEILRNMGWTRTENQIRRDQKRLRLWFPPQQEILEEMAGPKVETPLRQEVETPYSSENSDLF